jgi:hypothetical protein
MSQFEQKAQGIVLKPFFQTPLFFFDTDYSIFKTHVPLSANQHFA